MRILTKWKLLSLLLFLSISGVVLYFISYHYSDSLGLDTQSSKVFFWLLSMAGLLLFFLILSFTVLLHQKRLRTFLDYGEKEDKVNKEQNFINPYQVTLKHLKSRYGFFWRSKVRILLVMGEPSAVEQLCPELQSKQWLEGQNTVLIHGGSLNHPLDENHLNALRKLRKSQPLDGIVWVQSDELALNQVQIENGLRSFEMMSRTLGYQAPVWLWDLCESKWSQEGRVEQAVGALLPQNAKPKDVTKQLTELLPELRQQGLTQIEQDNQYDFLLRLGHEFAQNKIETLQQQLTPWLETYQKRVPLRGLMFSLPSEQQPNQESIHQNALFLSPQWALLSEYTSQLTGRKVGASWSRSLAMILSCVMGVWGLGLLLSAFTNYTQMQAISNKAHQITQTNEVNDAQLIGLHDLRNDATRLQQWQEDGTPWYNRFGLDYSQRILQAMLPWYGVANNRLIRDPADKALTEKLTTLTNLPVNSSQRAELAKPGYDELKAWLMMVRPQRADADFFSATMMNVMPMQTGISMSLWQSLAPDLWHFYADNINSQPDWQIEENQRLIAQTRQVLLEQIGRRNAESTLYHSMLESVQRNYADLTLSDMTQGSDAHLLFSTSKTVPGVFTRQAWEGGIQKAIDEAANARRDEIDWVLSDSKQNLSQDLSPETLKSRLTARYFSDFSSNWLGFLNSLQWRNTQSLSEVSEQLALMSDVRQSPFIALMNTLAWQGQTGQKGQGITDSLIDTAKGMIDDKPKEVISQKVVGLTGPLDETFGPLLTLMGQGSQDQFNAVDSSLSLQTYLTRVTRVRLRMQQVVNASDPQARVQNMAQTVFQGKSVDLTDTQEYGSLIAASLGEAWRGFGDTMFVEPLTQAWKNVLTPSAAGLNDTWERSIVSNWNTSFQDRYPFAINSKSESSIAMLAEFIRKDTGKLERFLNTQLKGVLHKEGRHWVVDSTNSQGLSFNPEFLNAINQLSELSDILFTDGKQGINFELQARPSRSVVETRLVIDGQKLKYFNQMPTWKSFSWPGDTYEPGTTLTWNSEQAGSRLYGTYAGPWGFIRLLDNAQLKRLNTSHWTMNFRTSDGHELKWVLRTQLENGPIALLSLHGFKLPTRIFNVNPS